MEECVDEALTETKLEQDSKNTVTGLFYSKLLGPMLFTEVFQQLFSRYKLAPRDVVFTALYAAGQVNAGFQQSSQDPIANSYSRRDFIRAAVAAYDINQQALKDYRISQGLHPPYDN